MPLCVRRADGGRSSYSSRIRPMHLPCRGGKIGVHTGFGVAKDQNQLATVLAPEVAHVLARHTNEGFPSSWPCSRGSA